MSTPSKPAEGAAAYVFSDTDSAKAERCGVADYVAGKVLYLIPLDCVRSDLFSGEGEGQIPNGPLLRIK